MEKETLHILLISSDRMVRLKISLMLEKSGYIISEAFSGMQAINLLMQNQIFDAIIMDNNLCDMSCSDFLHRIHSMSSNIKNISIIMLMHPVEKSKLKNSVILEMFDVIFKPIEKENLESVLKKALCKN